MLEKLGPAMLPPESSGNTLGAGASVRLPNPRFGSLHDDNLGVE